MVILLAFCLGQTTTPLPRPAPLPPPTRPASAPVDPAARDLAEYMSRSAALKPDDIDARLDLARWARDRKMWSEAADMAKNALYLDPYNRAAYTILQQVDDARPMPEEPQTAEALKNECVERFGHPFKTRNSKHFLICYDTTDAFATQRGAAMEQVYDAFLFYFNMNKLRPQFLDQRLVVILFKERNDFLAYLKATERLDFSWSAGVYTQRSNRSVFYDDTTDPATAGVVKEENDLRAKIDNLNAQIKAATQQGQTGLANQLTVERNRTVQALNRIAYRVDDTVNMRNDSKTHHEAAHQVAFNTGIQKRLVDYPMWFTEGLACSFETEDSAGRRGPAVMNYGRIGVLKEAIKNGKLMSVESMVTMGKPEKMDEASLGPFYAEGWGLFHYLYRTERAGMEKYLLAYQSRAPVRAIGPEERRKLFTDAFGDDFDALDKRFQNYIKSLPARP